MRFIFHIFLLLTNIAYAQEERIVTLLVSGTGKSLEEAKTNALRNAIEQTFGVFISSKTEILNDKLIKDQIITVSNGNIKKVTSVVEEKMINDTWRVSLIATISLDNLTSFVEAKGISVEFKGDLFAFNIKQQILNEQNEIKAISNLVQVLHVQLQQSFDYSIEGKNPSSVDDDNKYWEIPLFVNALANKNIDISGDYFIKILQALSLPEEQVSTYKSFGKEIFSVVIKYKGVSHQFYLRKKSSITALRNFVNNWKFYPRLFKVRTGIDSALTNVYEEFHDFAFFSNSTLNIFFLSAGEWAASFSLNDKKSLSQIEKMNGYMVQPRGVVSQFLDFKFTSNQDPVDTQSDRYTGNGGSGSGGSGFSISKGLQGRRIISRPSFEDDFYENARIAVDIKIDTRGNVISASIQPRGTTTGNVSMKSIALQKARQLKFTEDQNAPNEQLGTIVFNFRISQ